MGSAPERLGGVLWTPDDSFNPRHSMYATYAYIDPQNHPNVSIYGIHGASGNIESLTHQYSVYILNSLVT